MANRKPLKPTEVDGAEDHTSGSTQRQHTEKQETPPNDRAINMLLSLFLLLY